MTDSYKKKLIKAVLPLEDINREIARDKPSVHTVFVFGTPAVFAKGCHIKPLNQIRA